MPPIKITVLQTLAISRAIARLDLAADTAFVLEGDFKGNVTVTLPWGAWLTFEPNGNPLPLETAAVA